MENEIISKLKLALSEPIEKECQVIYILAETRKLLDRLRDKTILSVLRFYDNWALHIEIDKTSAVRPLLEKIENEILRGNKNIWGIMELVDFEEFRKEIGIFLSKFNINNPFIDINYWRNFRKVLVGILVDCPLKPNYGDMEEFCFVKSSASDNVDYIVKFKNRPPISGSWSFLNC